MTKLPIGIQLYSVRDEMEKDFEGTLKAIGKMGYTAVEFAGLFGHTAEEVKSICKQAGVAPVSAHVGMDAILKDLEGVIRTYAEIGCRTVVIPTIGAEFLPGGPRYGEFLQNIGKVAAELKKYDMILCYHNHDFEFDKVDGKNKLDILFADTDPAVLQTQIDTCWAQVGGEDPAAFVKKYTGRAPTVHLKDYVGEKSAKMYEFITDDKVESDESLANVPFELRPLGKGRLNVPAVVAAAEEAGAFAVIVEQDNPSMGKTPMECAEMSIRYLQSL